MATTVTVKVTSIPTLTGDTVASYNVYSSIDDLLDSMSIAEAADGHDVDLSDGATHSITVKAVWATAEETTTVGSNAVSVTTAGTTPTAISFTLESITESSEIYSNVSSANWSFNYGVSTTSYTGDFDFEVTIDSASTNGTMIGVSLDSSNRKWNDSTTDWDYGAYLVPSTDLIKSFVSSTATDSSQTAGMSSGQKLRMIRVSNSLKLYYDDNGSLTEVKDYGTVSGTAYLHISTNVDLDVKYPRVTV